MSWPVPLEVALMGLACRPLASLNLIQLLDWFEEDEKVILVLELPSPCMDVCDFFAHQGGRMGEDFAKTENLGVKLIDFSCWDLLTKEPYTSFAGMKWCAPPEWFVDGEYCGRPAMVWSLGVLLFTLVCGSLPFRGQQDIWGKFQFKEGLSDGDRGKISFERKRSERGLERPGPRDSELKVHSLTCELVDQDPRPRLFNIAVRLGISAGTRKTQFHLCWNPTNRWAAGGHQVFDRHVFEDTCLHRLTKKHEPKLLKLMDQQNTLLREVQGSPYRPRNTNAMTKNRKLDKSSSENKSPQNKQNKRIWKGKNLKSPVRMQAHSDSSLGNARSQNPAPKNDMSATDTEKTTTTSVQPHQAAKEVGRCMERRGRP
ncbi:hypothetical protein GJAV_G00266480 [Gymnothorax javanicus]|nr:hypothetical protein GJAV_G00266480 [Gymnothorax javanicus]